MPRPDAETLVLGLMSMHPTTAFSGADLTKQLGIAASVIYPLLNKLQMHGDLQSKWEEEEPADLGRPRRRLYMITHQGLTRKSPLEKLIEVHAVAGVEGNAGANGYLRGMYNGLELALSILQDREVVYREASTREKQEANLGCATTLELAIELKTRVELGHADPDYRSTDSN